VAKAGALDALKPQIQSMIEVEKLTQRKVAEMLGVNPTSIERACKRWGLNTQRTGPRDLDGHPNWKGGRYQLGRYWYVRADAHPLATKAGYVAEHRLVMESKIGRYLTQKEVVHHIDGNPENNHPDNLMVFQTNQQHLRHELTGRIPQWTEEGRARTMAGVMSKSDGSQQPQSTDHQPSSIDNNDVSQAS
jgi:hypothetical protein